MNCVLTISITLCFLWKAFAQLGGSGDEFCDSNKQQFGRDCNSRFSDNGENDFCSSYGVRCRGWKRPSAAVQQQPPLVQNNPPIVQNNPRIIQTNPAPKPQTVFVQQNPPSQVYPKQKNPNKSQHIKPPVSADASPDNVAYCRTHGKDYYALCLRGSVPEFASTFCNGFSAACPGVPSPGSLVGSPVKPVELSPQFQPAPNSLPPPIPSPHVPMSSVPLTPNNFGAQPMSAVQPQQFNPVANVPASPNLPSGGLQSLPSSPSLPSGGLSSLPSSPNLPSGGLSSLPSNVPSIPQSSPMGGAPASPGSFNPMQAPQGGVGLGQNVNAPFFNGMSGTNIGPTTGVGTGTSLNAAGMGVGSSQGVNFGNVPGLSALNSMGGLGSMGSGFGGKRRRRQTFARSLQYLKH